MATRRTISASLEHDPRDIRPIPDPTLLTTQQLYRELENLKELIEAKFVSSKSSFDQMHSCWVEALNREILSLKELRDEKFEDIKHQLTERQERFSLSINGVLQAIELTKEDNLKSFALRESAVNARFMAYEEKFNSIGVQFKERDLRIEQAANSSKEAIEHALNAAKEGVETQNKNFATSSAKAEAAAAKLMEQMALSLKTSTDTLDGRINDLKERHIALEGRVISVEGGHNQNPPQNQNIQIIVAYVIGALGLIVIVGTIFFFITNLPHK